MLIIVQSTRLNRRPFGVEQEFFVQLFVEHDPNLRVPTVGDLLRRMFIEQHITFTKVFYCCTVESIYVPSNSSIKLMFTVFSGSLKTSTSSSSVWKRVPIIQEDCSRAKTEHQRVD